MKALDKGPKLQLEHISKITKAKEQFLLENKYIKTLEYILDNKEIIRFLNVLKKFLDEKLYTSLAKNLNFVFDLNNNQFLALDCFLNYLYVYNFKEVYESISIINSHKNIICILYEEIAFDSNSKKIIISCNPRDFKVTVISNFEGLAELTGTFGLAFPRGYHKFPEIFKTLV